MALVIAMVTLSLRLQSIIKGDCRNVSKSSGCIVYIEFLEQKF